MAELKTVPTFIFKQGDIYDGGEQPVQVSYYQNDIVEIETDNGSVLISKHYAKALFREINKHWPIAQQFLDRK